uniref:Uncharacterized protein n=1 Tax=Anguilla anguilla TaxID=7936 RepID=A0A0E9QFH4_ANGAN
MENLRFYISPHLTLNDSWHRRGAAASLSDTVNVTFGPQTD